MNDSLHEMRQAMSAIKGFISTLVLDDDFSHAERKELYEIIDKECDRLIRSFADLKRQLGMGEVTMEIGQAIDPSSNGSERSPGPKLQGDASERLAALTAEEAREQLFARLEESLRPQLASRRKQLIQEAEVEAENRAKQVILNSIQRLASDYTIEATTAVVQLPSEDMKGKLIGREGRNIRTFEQVAGVDLIIDESPETVMVSSFDPVRREIARLTLMNMMLDGRIHPGRIEELYERAKQEIEKVIRESGEDAADRAKVFGVSKGVLQTLGRLRFRASYAQNVLDHSVEVAQLCALIAQELGLNVEVARRAGLLHDIGKALGSEWEGPHAIAGMNYLNDAGETEVVTLSVGAHHKEIEPSTPEAQVVIVADSISASRPGARRETLDQYMKRVSELEAVANAYPGVERSYAVQAGREIRLMVRPDQVSDEDAERLAGEVAKKIERDLQYPGQVKVVVIRETRVQRIAK